MTTIKGADLAIGIDMNKWDLIRKECPKLYQNDIQFECGIGWADLIHALSSQIEEILERHQNSNGIYKNKEGLFFEMFAVQVKEKYGRLRFYMNCQTKEIDDLIEEYEALSTQVCESCGREGKMRGRGWISVKCDDCYE